MFRILCILSLFLPITSLAETPQDLSLSNAFPDEIIKKLNAPTQPILPVEQPQNIVKLGTIASLYQHKDNLDLFDFALSLSDDSMITITQDNQMNFKPGDTVLIDTVDEKDVIIRSIKPYY